MYTCLSTTENMSATGAKTPAWLELNEEMSWAKYRQLAEHLCFRLIFVDGIHHIIEIITEAVMTEGSSKGLYFRKDYTHWSTVPVADKKPESE